MPNQSSAINVQYGFHISSLQENIKKYKEKEIFTENKAKLQKY